MKATDLLPLWRRVLAAHAAFGLLGFDPGDLFVFFQPLPGGDAAPHAFVRVVQGSLDLDIDCGALDGEPHPKARWLEALRAWNATDQAGRDHVYRETYNAELFTLLGVALAARGIHPPAVPRSH